MPHIIVSIQTSIFNKSPYKTGHREKFTKSKSSVNCINKIKIQNEKINKACRSNAHLFDILMHYNSNIT